MDFLKFRLAAVVTFAGVITGCGSPGVPLPPSLELAQPINDVRAVRKGDKVVLTWTVPRRTTDGHNIRRPGETVICGNVGGVMSKCGTPIAKIKIERPDEKEPRQMSYTHQVPENLQLHNPRAEIFYAVNVVNPYGRSAGLSNQVSVPAAPTLPAPAEFNAQLSADGVKLSWAPIPVPPDVTQVRYAIRIYRREQGQAADAIAGEGPLASGSNEFTDRGFEWEKTYAYRATVVTYIPQTDGSEHQVEGDDTLPVVVFAHDVFPPAAPAGLQAVFSGPGQKPFIDLVWTPNSEPDLAGYNVYRREGADDAVKMNSEPAKSPAWRDSAVAPGGQYSYSVTAVDMRGNESARSREASESVPAQ